MIERPGEFDEGIEGCNLIESVIIASIIVASDAYIKPCYKYIIIPYQHYPADS